MIEKNITANQILSGDCIEILASFPEASFDLVFADPPYNLQLKKDLWRPNNTKVDPVDDEWDKFRNFEEYDLFTHAWLSACKRVMKKSSTLWVIGSYHNIFRIGKALQDLDFWILNDVIWIKDNPMPNFRGVRLTNAHETLIWAQKTKGIKHTFNHHSMKALNDDLQMRSDWYMPICIGEERCRVDGEKGHTTQKPESLLYRIILASTNPGDIILDPFFGTGTTGAVAKKMGRNFVGIERDPNYVDIAKKRIEDVNIFPPKALYLPEPKSWSRVPFGRLLEEGLIQPGQILTFSKDESITAMVLANGHIQFGSQIGSIHTVARSILDGAPANGWDSWLFEDQGHRYSINVLRQKFSFPKGNHAQTSKIKAS